MNQIDWYSLWGVSNYIDASHDPDLAIKAAPVDLLHPDLSAEAKICHLWLKFLACHEDFQSYSVQRLAEDLSASVATVSKWVAELRDNSLLNEFHDTWILRNVEEFACIA